MNITITVPKKEKNIWAEEVIRAFNEGLELLFKVPFLPKRVNKLDKCYIIIENQIVGYHLIKALEYIKEDWKCEITGRVWEKGNYIVRYGNTWTKFKQPIKAQSHRGFRYTEERR